MEYKNLDDRKIEKEESMVEIEEEDVDEVIEGFNFFKMSKSYPTEKENIDQFKEFLISESETAKINIWDIQNIGLQAAQMIIDSSNPVERMKEISWNLPSYIGPLSRVNFNSSLQEDANLVGDQFGPGNNLIFLNGNQLNINTQSFNIFEFYDLLTGQISEMNLLKSFEIPNSDIESLKEFLRNTPQQTSRINLFEGNDKAVVYLNDVETDRKYSQMSSDIRQILEPTFQVHPIRKNIYNIIAFIRIGSMEGKELISGLYQVHSMGAPIRMGFVINSNEIIQEYQNKEIDINSLNADMDSVISDKDMIKILGFFNRYAKNQLMKFIIVYVQFYDETITLGKFIDRICSQTSIKKSVLIEFLSKEESLEYLIDNTKYVTDHGMELDKVTLNGKIYTDLGTLINRLSEEMREIIKYVETEEINDETDVFEFICKDSLTAYDSIILSKNPEIKSILSANQQDFNSPERIIGDLVFFGERSKMFLHTFIYIADLTENKNLEISVQLLNHLSVPNTRLYISCISEDKVDFCITINKIFYQMGKYESKKIGYMIIQDVLSDIMKQSLFDPKDIIEIYRKHLQISENRASVFINELDSIQVDNRKLYAFLESNEKINLIFYNGRIIRNLDKLSGSSINLLESLDSNLYLKIKSIIKENEESSLTFLRLLSFIKTSEFSYSRDIKFRDSLMLITNNNKNKIMKLNAIIDPLSVNGQRLVAICSIISTSFNDFFDFQILLNPVVSTTEFPLKRFYRFIVGKIGGAPNSAVFTNLPQKQILTMGIETPDSWVVQTGQAEHDIDNIDMSSSNVLKTNGIVYVEYILKYLIVQGSCIDLSSKVQPQGLQLSLKTGHYNTDSIVMQNLYYYQLKTFPGIYNISLAAGRSREIYDILDGSRIKNPKNVAKKDLTNYVIESETGIIRDFSAKYIPLYVMKKIGKESESVLVEEEKKKENWFSIFKSEEKKDVISNKNETLHVFSLASGHLYERFIKIMMMSVVEHTKNPVKFWFVENFFSPAIKSFLPHYAKELGCEVELVTYKWPRWLFPQTEKQRIIWAYKILFLDVLFPIDLKKIVYIDADQVVRADIKELFDMDLQGKPYGYTPFCSSNKETLGFQFWRQGFWKSHLGSNPYHISALYIVDLVVFRKLAGGDILRMTYDSLSRDPNSLSNLDQDLPNYAQKQLPIFSLPQEWLWCESWCSLESKKDAKTIDLCNNPMYKEPKLDMARRVISGDLFNQSWVELDNRIHEIETKYI